GPVSIDVWQLAKLFAVASPLRSSNDWLLSCSKTCPPVGTPHVSNLPLPQGDPSLNSPDGGRMVFRKHKGGPGAFEVHESIVSSRFVVPVFHQPSGCSAATFPRHRY